MSANKTDSTNKQPITNIDRLIHEPARYLIMAYLYVVESADALFLQGVRSLQRAVDAHAHTHDGEIVARAALGRYAPDSPWLALLGAGPELARRPETPQFVAIPASDEPPVPFDEDAIAAVLADEARCRRWLPGYRVREEQIRLAREFTRALADGGRLLLEGGTGVGKSLAYLAAAIPFAMERAAVYSSSFSKSSAPRLAPGGSPARSTITPLVPAA